MKENTIKTFYQVSHPSFSGVHFNRLAKAEKYISDTANHKGEYSEYWKEQACKMYIQKITQIAEFIK